MIKSEDLEIGKTVSKKLEEAMQGSLIKVILFGSRARGESHSESDFDFLVIGDFIDPSWPNRSYTIRKTVGYLGHAVDYIPVTEEEFEHKLMIHAAIKKEGIVLYER